MYQRDFRDMTGGALMMLLGAAVAIYAWISYPVGTIREMGPGMFPIALGTLLFFLGALIFVPAFSRNGPKFAALELRPLAAISLAGLAFALTIERFGIIPAVFVMTTLAALGDTRLKWRGMAILGACLAIGAFLIFKTGLDLPVQAFRWPF